MGQNTYQNYPDSSVDGESVRKLSDDNGTELNFVNDLQSESDQRYSENRLASNSMQSN